MNYARYFSFDAQASRPVACFAVILQSTSNDIQCQKALMLESRIIIFVDTVLLLLVTHWYSS